MGLPAAKDPIAQLSLPPGFRFNPTDEELLVQYLCRKVIGHEFSLQIIADVDLYKFDPWVLPSKAVFGEQEWYFFSPRDRKYPNGSRPNRVAGCGYWKATGTDKVITSQGRKLGIKKSLVFYVGRAPKGTKTNWIMHEFRLFDSPRSTCSSKLDDWVLCRIYQKNSGGAAKSTAVASSAEHSAGGGSSSTSSSTNRLVLENFGSVSLDWGVLAGLTAGLENGATGPNQAQGNQVGHVVGDGGGTWEKFGNRVMEDEVESRLRTQRINQESPNMMWAHSYSNSGDPLGLRYTAPNPVEAFGFRP